jgi:hypothetical protein
VAVAILAALDSVFGGINAKLHNRFDVKLFISGFFGNAFLAAALTFIGRSWTSTCTSPPWSCSARDCSRILPKCDDGY